MGQRWYDMMRTLEEMMFKMIMMRALKLLTGMLMKLEMMMRILEM